MKNDLFWEYLKNRKNEEKRNSLPKRRFSKRFTNKADAILYCTLNKHNWLQAKLLQWIDSRGYCEIASVDTHNQYHEI
jgi:hypothetical protein